ncbi:MAG: RHS repeat-associated core domain-containing protein [Planctomycetota bacterium]
MSRACSFLAALLLCAGLGLQAQDQDAQGRPLTAEIDGEVVKLSYPEEGVVVMDYPDGSRARLQRSESEVVEERFSPEGRLLESRTLDGEGRVTSTRDEFGRDRYYSYTADGVLESIRSNLGLVAKLTHDDQGRIVRVVDAEGNAFTAAYEDRSCVLEDPATGTRVRRFNDKGLIESEERGGYTVSYTYDAQGNLTKREVEGREDPELFSYDGEGRLISQKGPDGGLEYRYDDRGQLVKITFLPLKKSIEYRYDGAGRRIETELPWGKLRYTYDDEDELVAVEGPHAGKVELEYEGGNRVRVRYPNGVETRCTWEDGRLAALTTVKGTQTLFRREYRYSRKGRIAEVEREDKTASKFSHDADGRLKRVRGAEVWECRYDALGNRVQEKAGAQDPVTSTYGPGNRLLKRGKEELVYDAQGRTIARGQVGYTYDPHSRLSAVELADGSLIRYGYAPSGQLLWREDRKGRVYYLSDREGTFGAVDRKGKLLWSCLLGDEVDELFAWSPGGEPAYVHYDLVRSVIGLTDGQGKVVARYAYAAFGSLLSSEGPLAEENPFRFTSRPQDRATGLYDLRARTYDPELGRFLTPDPLSFAGGINLYLYVENDPTLRRDPLGLSPWVSQGDRLRAVPVWEPR